MSPAGPQGRRRRSRPRDGDRLRPQHGRHLPPQRASTSACTSCRAPRRSPTRRTATSSRFDPASRRLTQRDAGQDLRAGAAVAEGRRDPPQRRHLRGRPPRVPRVGRDRAGRSTGPTPALARRMTTTEQIVWAHRVDKDRADDLQPGATLRVYADLLPASDGTAPFAIHTFNQITGGDTIYPRQAAIANDHFVFTGKDDDDKQTRIGREFARLHGIEKPYYATPGDGIFHFYFPEQGLVHARAVHSRRRLAQPRLRRVRRGRHRRRIDDARVRLVDRLHLLHAREGSGASCSTGGCSRGSAARTSSSSCCGAGARSSRRACRWSSSTRDRQLPIAYRNTIANMMAEAEALNGIFAPDDITYAWYRAKGITELPYPPFAPGADARVRDRRDARPRRRAADDRQAVQSRQRVSRRGGRARAHHVRQGDDRLVHQRQLRRSAAGGARAARGARRRASTKAATRVRDLSRDRAASGGRSSGPIRGSAASRSPRCSARSAARSASRGAARASARARTRSTQGQRAITSFNRNWQNRMGLGGEGYLASPAVVAASALARLHGAAERARAGLGSGDLRRLSRSAGGRNLQSGPQPRERLRPFAWQPRNHRRYGLDRLDLQILDRPRDAHVSRDRPRRRQHHLHLDPLRQAAAAQQPRGAPARPARRDAHAHRCCCSRSRGSSG